MSAAWRLTPAPVNSGLGPCGGSSAGMRANTPKKKQQRRDKHPEEPQLGHQADHQISGDDRPAHEHGGFEKIVDRTMLETEPAQAHGRDVQTEPRQQQQVINPVVLAKAAAPQGHRVRRARPVHQHGQQKKMTVGKPIHLLKVNQLQAGGKGQLGRGY